MKTVHIATLRWTEYNSDRRRRSTLTQLFAGISEDAAHDKADDFMRELASNRFPDDMDRALAWCEEYCEVWTSELPL